MEPQAIFVFCIVVWLECWSWCECLILLVTNSTTKNDKRLSSWMARISSKLLECMNWLADAAVCQVDRQWFWQLLTKILCGRVLLNGCDSKLVLTAPIQKWLFWILFHYSKFYRLTLEIIIFNRHMKFLRPRAHGIMAHECTLFGSLKSIVFLDFCGSVVSGYWNELNGDYWSWVYYGSKPASPLSLFSLFQAMAWDLSTGWCSSFIETVCYCVPALCFSSCHHRPDGMENKVSQRHE